MDIDRYGRPLPDQRSNLEKYYAVEGEESEKSREKKRPKLAAKQTKSQEEKNKKKKKDESSEESSEGESFEGSDGSGDPSSSLSGSSGSSGLSGSGSDSGDEPNVPGSGSESGESGEGEGEGDEDSSFTSMSSDSSWSGEENVSATPITKKNHNQTRPQLIHKKAQPNLLCRKKKNKYQPVKLQIELLSSDLIGISSDLTTYGIYLLVSFLPAVLYSMLQFTKGECT